MYEEQLIADIKELNERLFNGRQIIAKLECKIWKKKQELERIQRERFERKAIEVEVDKLSPAQQKAMFVALSKRFEL